MDEGNAEAELKPAQFRAHAHAQKRIQRRERFVEQQDLRLRDQRPSERHALLLAARQLRGHALSERIHRNELEEFHRLLAARRLVDPAHLQGERDIVEAGQMREQRVALKHHRRAALGGRQVGNVGVADQNVAFGGAFVAGDHPQRGGLAASRWPEQTAIGVRRHAQIDRVDGGSGAVSLGDVDKFQAAGIRHCLTVRREIVEQ